MSRVEQIRLDVAAYAQATDLVEQRFYARQIWQGCHLTGENMHQFLVPASGEAKHDGLVECPHCSRNDFKNRHALRAHIGRKHKS